MRFGIRTLDELDVKGKTVLCRVDINQPVDRATGTLKSINRIRACVPTVRELSDKGAKLVLMAHQGSDIEYKNFYTTKPHAAVLTELLGREVKWIDDVCGPAAREAIRSLKEGEILLLDNVRFVSEEQTLFETKLHLTHEQQAKTLLVEKLAPLGDVYVCDAFAAAHRDQPSLCGFEQVLPSAMGRLFEQEYCTVSQVMEEPVRPCVFVLGGAKISDAFLMMQTVLSRGVADKILTGGLVGNIFLTALGEECDIVEGYEIGADEYITKPFSTKLLQMKINALINRYRGLLVKNGMIVMDELVIEPAKRRVTVNGAEITLAPKEYDLLIYLIENKGIVLSRNQILDQVWGHEYEGYDRAVDTHIKKLRAALGDSGSHVETVIKAGYKWS